MPKVVKISDYLLENLIELDLKSTTKEDVLKELTELIAGSENITDKDMTYKALIEREKLGSTGIGKHVAIPHAKTDSASKLTIAFGISKKGVPFDSMDKEDVNVFFVFASPLRDSQVYLKVLARISRLIRNEEFRNKLLAQKTPKDILECIDSEESL